MYKNLSRLVVNQLVLSNVCLGGYISGLNVRLKPFILGLKSNYYILDISYTHIQLKLLINVLINIVSLRQKILIVRDLDFYNLLVDFNYKNMFFYNAKWVGGILTNFKVVRRSQKFLEVDGFFNGLQTMKYMPSLIFLFNTQISKWALFEAFNLDIPVAAVLNSDSEYFEFVNYPIIGNNKSFESLYLYVTLIKNALLKGQQKERLKILRIL